MADGEAFWAVRMVSQGDIEMMRFVKAAVAAAVLSGSAVAADAATFNVSGNLYGGTLDANETLGPIDLDTGAFAFSGFAGDDTGGLTVDFISSSLVPAAAGSFQFQFLSGTAGAILTLLKFDGVDLLPSLSVVDGGWAVSFSGALPSAFEFAFQNANAGDQIQVTVSAVPLPAGGLLLIGGLGALAALRRRKTV